MAILPSVCRTLGSTATLACLSLSLLANASSDAQARRSTAMPSSVVGTYDGSQMEIGARLELRSNGRFRYALAYGALDERAEGSWTVEGDRVLLTSGPINAPVFVFFEQPGTSDGKMRIVLDLPTGWSRQVFDAEVTLADGRVIEQQLSDDTDVLDVGSGARPLSVRLELPVYGLRSRAFSVPGAGGSSVHARFEPNDLGWVAFARTALQIQAANLILERYGRTIVFRRERS